MSVIKMQNGKKTSLFSLGMTLTDFLFVFSWIWMKRLEPKILGRVESMMCDICLNVVFTLSEEI
jgi:hypothetical protein